MKTGEWKLNISKEHICEVFKEYTDKYDSSETKIKLKIDHTYRVAKMCERIAKDIGLCEADINLAWLVGMLHDIGRFEQVRRYNTFNDYISIDHAIFGAMILFDDGLIWEFIGNKQSEADMIKEELDLVRLAISNHSAYRIPDYISEREVLFCNIIRDADKIDILKVNSELPLEEIYNVSTDELKNAPITEDVMKAFYEEHAVLRKLKRTPVDNVVGHVSLCYELVFPISYKMLIEQGYIYKLMAFESYNSKTNDKFVEIRKHMEEFLRRKAEGENKCFN